MRTLPLLLLAALACTPTEPRGPLDGAWLGTYQSNPIMVGLTQHDFNDSTVTGTWSHSRTGTIQGVMRYPELAVTVTFTDSCGGSATGVWIYSVPPFELKGTLNVTDCSGSSTGTVALEKAAQNL